MTWPKNKPLIEREVNLKESPLDWPPPSAVIVGAFLTPLRIRRRQNPE